MRNSFLLAALLIAACSGASEEKKADTAPTDGVATESKDGAETPPDEPEEPDAAPVAAAIDLDAVEDLETLFEVSGNVSRDQVAGIIGQNKPDVHQCYADALAANPGMTGRVYVQITATANGSVATAMMKQTTLKKPAVEQCMLTRIRGWKFPNDDSGGLTVIKYAFQLPP